MLALALLSIRGVESFQVKIPGHEVQVSIEIPGFKRDTKGEIPGRTLLIGTLPDETTLSLLWEENFPYVAGASGPNAYTGEQGFHAFNVGDKTCCQFRMVIHKLIVDSQYYGFLATSDFFIILHASRSYPLKGGGDSKEVSASRLEPIVRSLSVSGAADRSRYRYPAEVYSFRDEAAKLGSTQMDWVEKQCAARSDDWVPFFYLGELGSNSRKPDPELRGFQRASDLLGKRPQPSTKEMTALLHSLHECGGCLASQKKFDQAASVCQKILDLVPTGSSEEFREFRAVALFNLACCSAMTSKPDQAMKYLRQAIEARPEFKKRAAQEEWLASLHNKAEFKKLVGP